MEDFVTFDIAKKLKDIGFNEPCFGFYFPNGNLVFRITYDGDFKDCLGSLNKNDNIISHDFFDAPTISQVLKWLREEKKMHIIVEISDSGWYYTIYPSIRWENGKLKSDTYIMSFKHKDSYEQAALAGIEYVLDNLI